MTITLINKDIRLVTSINQRETSQFLLLTCRSSRSYLTLLTIRYYTVLKSKIVMVRIHYEDNRRKGRSWDIPLKNNMIYNVSIYKYVLLNQ